MFSAFVRAFKTPDLRRKLLFTIGIMVVFRIGSFLPTPGISYSNVQACIEQAGSNDTLLGSIDVREPGSVGDPGADDLVEVWMSANQFAYWRHTHLTIDLVPGRGAGFSLEGPTGFRFLIRSRLFTDEEAAELGETPKVGLVPPT